MQGAGIKVETSKGEAWPGQHEINFRYADALTMADNHVIYKNGAKEIAHLNGCSITFMAKPDHTWIGSSCHIHSSLWRGGESAFAGETAEFNGWLAGQIACLKELAVFLAPNVNSYKRFAAGSWAPTTLAWGRDNRTCGFRIVGHGPALRTETRIPGADANPYLAFAAIIAAGLHGIEQRARAAAGARGQRLRVRRRSLPAFSARGDRGARGRLDGTRGASATRSIDHYLNYARTEQHLFDRGRDVATSGSGFRAWVSLGFELMQAPIGPASNRRARRGGLRRPGGLGTLAASWTPVDVLRRQVQVLSGAPLRGQPRPGVRPGGAAGRPLRGACSHRHVLVGVRPDLVARAHAAGSDAYVQAGSAEAARRAVGAGADAVHPAGDRSGWPRRR